MPISRRGLRAQHAFAAVVALATMAATAQEWPTKPIRMIAPQAPGGGPERVIRGIAQVMGQRLGQPVVVDYKPGAAGNLGTADLARSPADGYTWMLGPENMLTINPFIYKSTGFNRSDVAAVNMIASLNQLLACHPKVGVKTLPDLVKAAKAKPLTYSSAGPGSNGHLAMEMLLSEVGAEMTHVPYRGPAPAVQDVLSGQVDCTFIVTAALIEHVKSKRIDALATTANSRIPSLPEVPTMKDVGLPNFEGNFWLGMFAPKGVPKAIQDKFGKALDEAIRSPEVREAMAMNNTILVGTTPEVAQAEINKAAQRWEKVAKRLSLSLE
ncbi:MAG: hypothetical protein RJA09_586 [Pseudomonadota bacterium]